VDFPDHHSHLHWTLVEWTFQTTTTISIGHSTLVEWTESWIIDTQFIGLDENGRYSGSVAENLQPGTDVITVTATDPDVITVTATDRDEFPDFKKVFHSMLRLK